MRTTRRCQPTVERLELFVERELHGDVDDAKQGRDEALVEGAPAFFAVYLLDGVVRMPIARSIRF
jgi:hypothetical protein